MTYESSSPLTNWSHGLCKQKGNVCYWLTKWKKRDNMSFLKNIRNTFLDLLLRHSSSFETHFIWTYLRIPWNWLQQSFHFDFIHRARNLYSTKHLDCDFFNLNSLRNSVSTATIFATNLLFTKSLVFSFLEILQSLDCSTPLLARLKP